MKEEIGHHSGQHQSQHKSVNLISSHNTSQMN